MPCRQRYFVKPGSGSAHVSREPQLAPTCIPVQDNTSSGDDDGDGFVWPSWTIPTADAVLCLLWGLSAYLFNLGSEAFKEAETAAKRAAKDRLRSPLLGR